METIKSLKIFSLLLIPGMVTVLITERTAAILVCRRIIIWLKQIFSGLAERPRWSPDGRHISFTSTRSGNFDIWIMDIDIDEIKEKIRNLNNHVIND